MLMPYNEFADFKESLLDALPDAVIWMLPVKSPEGVIEDFEVGYANQQAEFERRQPGLGPYVGMRIKRDGLPTRELSEENFQNYLEVFQNGQPKEYSFFVPHLGRTYDILRKTYKGGVLSISHDRSAQHKAEQKQREQAKFSQSILNASLNGIYLLEGKRDESGRIVDFIFLEGNKRFEELVRIPIASIKGRTLLELFPHSKDSGLFELLLQGMEMEQAFSKVPYFATSFNRWYDYTLVKLGENRLVVTFQDITEQKAAIERIEQQKNLLDNLLRHSPAGITITEVIRDIEGLIIDGRTIISNEAAEKFTGIPNALGLTKTIAEIDPAILQSPLYQMALSTLKTGTAFSTQYFFEPTGRWLELSVAKMDEDHLINVFLDITETREAQLRQEKLLQELQRTNADLEEFSYASSHDLKEPIRKILIFSDRLQEKLAGKLSEEERLLLERLHYTASRMQTLVNDLLEYSQVSQKTALTEQVDLNEKINWVLCDLELVIEENGANIHIDRLPVIKGHRRQLGQLFQNLLSNALKYHRPGVAPQVNITCRKIKGIDTGLPLLAEEQNREYYRLEVTDDGIGFAREDAERIFQVFQRLQGREYPGSGIGLAIARKVAQNHGGDIMAISEPGKGATFRVLLPVK